MAVFIAIMTLLFALPVALLSLVLTMVPLAVALVEETAATKALVADNCPQTLLTWMNTSHGLVTAASTNDSNTTFHHALGLADYAHVIQELLEHVQNTSLSDPAISCSMDQSSIHSDENDATWRLSFQAAYCRVNCANETLTMSNIFAETNASTGILCCSQNTASTTTIVVDTKGDIREVCSVIQESIVEQCNHGNSSLQSNMATRVPSPAVAQDPTTSPTVFSIKLGDDMISSSPPTIVVAASTNNRTIEPEQIIEITRAPKAVATAVPSARPTIHQTSVPTAAPATGIVDTSSSLLSSSPSVLPSAMTEPSIPPLATTFPTMPLNQSMAYPAANQQTANACTRACQLYVFIVLPSAISCLLLVVLVTVWYDRRQQKSRKRAIGPCLVSNDDDRKVNHTEHSDDDDCRERVSIVAVPSIPQEAKSFDSGTGFVATSSSFPLSPDSNRRLHDLLETFHLESLTDNDLGPRAKGTMERSTPLAHECQPQTLPRVSRSRLQHESMEIEGPIHLFRSISMASDNLDIVFGDDASTSSQDSDHTPVMRHNNTAI
jgi:hypothetical protein